MTYREEYQNVALGLSGVNLKDGSDGGVKVVCFGLRGVMNIDRVSTTRDWIVTSDQRSGMHEIANVP